MTSQDGTQPFKVKPVDIVITNPPFGSATTRDYDGYKISSLEGQMAINALESMKGDGRAAIIIGGNTEYAKNGSRNAYLLALEDVAFLSLILTLFRGGFFGFFFSCHLPTLSKSDRHLAEQSIQVAEQQIHYLLHEFRHHAAAPRQYDESHQHFYLHVEHEYMY